MKRLLKIMNEIMHGIDYENCEELITGDIYSSFEVISLVAAIEEEFGISITPKELNVDNFDSAKKIWKLIEAKRCEAKE